MHFLLDDLRQEIPSGPEEITDGAIQRHLDHPWPGNIRELRNVLERALIFARDAGKIDVRHLPRELRRTSGSSRGVGFAPESLAEVERRHIERMLVHHKGNRSRAAKDLGIAWATLINKIKVFGLEV